MDECTKPHTAQEQQGIVLTDIDSASINEQQMCSDNNGASFLRCHTVPHVAQNSDQEASL